MLPAALDPELLRQARDRMWQVLDLELPRMRRDDPKTWQHPIEPEEITGASEEPGLAPDDPSRLFGGSGHRFYLHVSEEPLFRNLFPLALHDVAEQLLGEGTVRWPRGPDGDGLVRGPFFNALNGPTHKALVGVPKYEHWVGKGWAEFPPPMATEEIAVPQHSPAVNMIDGSRGMYCTLPAGEGHAPQKGENTRERGYPGAHADVPTVTTQPGVHADDRCRLRATIYTDDCPKDAGGL